mmetsp:Transcript_20729/g.34152  ORF Transcript_20729/g.34152 Transcript_20729/m.34152 type:complete len:294 (-) Transcript_20729:966-1847(-)
MNRIDRLLRHTEGRFSPASDYIGLIRVRGESPAAFSVLNPAEDEVSDDDSCPTVTSSNPPSARSERSVYEGDTCSHHNVIVLLDNSNKMAGMKMHALQTGLRSLVDNLHTSDRISFATFGDSVAPSPALKPVDEFDFWNDLQSHCCGFDRQRKLYDSLSKTLSSLIQTRDDDRSLQEESSHVEVIAICAGADEGSVARLSDLQPLMRSPHLSNAHFSFIFVTEDPIPLEDEEKRSPNCKYYRTTDVTPARMQTLFSRVARQIDSTRLSFASVLTPATSPAGTPTGTGPSSFDD